WEKLDLNSAYVPWMVATATRFDPDDPKYLPLSYRGLVMPKLRQFRAKRGESPPPENDPENHYPNLERKLKKLDQALKGLEAKKPEEIALPPAQFSPGDGFDVFNAGQGSEGSTTQGPLGMGGPPVPGGGSGGSGIIPSPIGGGGIIPSPIG